MWTCFSETGKGRNGQPLFSKNQGDLLNLPKKTCKSLQISSVYYFYMLWTVLDENTSNWKKHCQGVPAHGVLLTRRRSRCSPKKQLTICTRALRWIYCGVIGGPQRGGAHWCWRGANRGFPQQLHNFSVRALLERDWAVWGQRWQKRVLVDILWYEYGFDDHFFDISRSTPNSLLTTSVLSSASATKHPYSGRAIRGAKDGKDPKSRANQETLTRSQVI